MPNWCNNTLFVSHKDKEMMQKFHDGVRSGTLFDTFIPMPDELRETTADHTVRPELIEKYGHSDWYGWCLENWGCKWDCNDGEFELDEDGLSGNGWFDTAWGPPIAAYGALQELGFIIEAGYNEPGMGFAGTWVDGSEDYVDNYYDLFENGYDPKDNDYLLNDYLTDFLESEYENWLQMKEEEENETDDGA